MSEEAEQVELVAWFRKCYPMYAQSLRISQSGGFKGKGRAGAIRMAKAKAAGVVTGESDIASLLPRNGYGAFLMEYKKSGGAYKATPAQLEYLDYHRAIGNCACVCRGPEAAKAAITAYMGEDDTL